ncbi:cytosolic carboxypeptidase 4 [Anopheles sinensis]|uniref:Cytosolic carboxypeptidase 4 n=1 Tax=Anopheles sinensis TaxID=74873 RepID=A0A084V9Z1_ANOSI|nr:cytosolic carboxypeptidase 4 [Anopheles sinensis]
MALEHLYYLHAGRWSWCVNRTRGVPVPSSPCPKGMNHGAVGGKETMAPNASYHNFEQSKMENEEKKRGERKQNRNGKSAIRSVPSNRGEKKPDVGMCVTKYLWKNRWQLAGASDSTSTKAPAFRKLLPITQRQRMQDAKGHGRRCVRRRAHNYCFWW